jgi:hypothetical protein
MKIRTGRGLALQLVGALGSVVLVCAPEAAAGGGRGGASGRVPRDVVIGTYGRGPMDYERVELADGTVLGISAFCVDERGGVVVLDAAGRRVAVYGPGGARLRDVSLPDSCEGLRVAAAGRRLYALCASRGGRAAPARAGRTGVGDVVRCVGARASRPRADLQLIAWRAGTERWEELADVARLPRGRPGGGYGRVFLVRCGIEIYLCDPATCASAKLTEGGGPAAGRRVAVWEKGRRLPSGGRAVRCGWGISLLWEDGSRRDMPWLAGSLIGGDLAGRLYLCEVGGGDDRAKVTVAAYGEGALAVARWSLPGRPGEVRMLGARVIVSDDGGLYEFWSTRSEFHIARWEIERELAEGRPH